MRKEQVIKIIGKKNWKSFDKFMFGQGVGIYPDGTTNFYKCDVQKYLLGEYNETEQKIRSKYINDRALVLGCEDGV